MGREALDHESRAGENERGLARAPADEASERQRGGEDNDERKGRQRRQMTGEQPSP